MKNQAHKVSNRKKKNFFSCFLLIYFENKQKIDNFE